MFTLRCTQKLLREMGSTPVSRCVPTTTLLGDWYGNIVPTCRGGIVICTNERTLLTVILPLLEGEHPLAMFTMRVYNLLKLLGISTKAAEAELERMDEVQIAKTVDRRVLGTMNEIAQTLQFLAEDTPGQLNASEGELFIADSIYTFTKYKRPKHLVSALLEQHSEQQH